MKRKNPEENTSNGDAVDDDHQITTTTSTLEEGSSSSSKKMKVDQANDEQVRVLSTRWEKCIALDEQLINQVYDIICMDLLKESSGIFSQLLSSNYFEHVLWNNFDSGKNSREFIFSLIVLINEKCHHANFKDIATDSKFEQLYNLAINLEYRNTKERLILIVFLINCFSHIDLLNRLCLDYVSLPLWTHVNPSRRNTEISKRGLTKYWKKFTAKKNNSDSKSEFVPSLVTHFLESLKTLEDSENDELMTYCERFLEFLIDLLSQIPTRKFTRLYLLDTHVLEYSRLFLRTGAYSSKFFELVEKYEFYLHFDINDDTGEVLSATEYAGIYAEKVANLQLISFQHFPEKLKDLTVQTVATVQSRDYLDKILSTLNKEELVDLCKQLDLVGKYETGEDFSEELLIEMLISNHERKPSPIEKINTTSLYPTERTIWSEGLTEESNQINLTYKGLPSVIPKLGIQYLSLFDYLIRNYELFKLEKTYSLRQSLENTITNLEYSKNPATGKTQFHSGFRMALPMSKPFEIVEVAPPNVGETSPSKVEGVITINISSIESQNIREEWENIRKNDILFLVQIKAKLHSNENDKFDDRFGIVSIRGCELLRQEDEDGNVLNNQTKVAEQDETLEFELSTPERRLVVLLDPIQYLADRKEQEKSRVDVYSHFNLVIRQKPKDNNFKSVLESIRSMMNNGTNNIVSWVSDYILGYEPSFDSSETVVDFRNTFQDESHIRESLDIPNDVQASSPINSNYFTVTFGLEKNVTSYSSYIPRELKSQNASGNSYKFNKEQVKAIQSAISPEKGLTYIQTPPGSGKHNVLTKIIENIYVSNPNQRTVIIARSNLALNGVFEQLKNSEVHERHLLRLGGEKNEYSKFGRVNYLVQKRIEVLKTLEQVATSLGYPPFTNISCETASHFFIGNIHSHWKSFLELCGTKDKDLANESMSFFENNFPFQNYFREVMNEEHLFSSEVFNENLDMAHELYSELKLLFELINECKVLENIRTYQSRCNHILTQQSRVVAMTSTHAAVKRKEFQELNFNFDTLIIEDAGRISEIESFIPMTISKRIKKIILIGDVNQMKPVVYNKQIEPFSNLDQSLFTRFGRFIDEEKMIKLPFCSSQISSSLLPLFKWNYPNTYDHVTYSEEKLKGFKFNYQLINVEDFQGRGETVLSSHMYQNQGEAEYAVALYMYLRLIGYSLDSITILTSYQAQKTLIRDILKQRCESLGYPVVTTIDRYQGRVNDIVILSTVRTTHPGHLNNPHRLSVAFSSARNALFVLCRQSLLTSKCNPFITHSLEESFSKNGRDANTLIVQPKEELISVKSVFELGSLVQNLAIEKYSQ